ncbi:MAG TPA: retroviral-like aspartic protease family protein [Leptolyngbyaceae cyanobacterium M65_K2018_010]|nr:retroviral-like aspartic protease family protein [Leptolyngbyaceae cyanobacterium M65_K2018_010]
MAEKRLSTALEPAALAPTHSSTPAPQSSGTPADPSPTVSPPGVPVQPPYFREAVNRATSAVAIGQSAQSQEDWQLAASRWQQAIQLMQRVPASSAEYAQAQGKVQEYQQHLAVAQRRATGQPVPPPRSPVAPAPAKGLVAQIPIQERRGGTPVVIVTLEGQQGKQSFPMLFDTGATGTLITADMAQAIGVVVIGETQAKIADGSVITLPVGYVDGLEVGGLRKQALLVAIGGSVGLLGQDVYGEYGIALGSQVIHLHQ